MLAFAGTFAGNLTIEGSVANLIMLEATRELVSIGFFRRMTIGVPVTVVTLVLAAVAARIGP